MKEEAQTNSTEYYLALKYPITLREMSVDEGGGYLATIPKLGEKTFIADGATPAEALEALDDLRRELIPQLIANGVPLPDPAPVADPAEAYSGSLMLRVSRSLHGRLVAAAKRNGISLNKLAAELLAGGLGECTVIEDLNKQLQDTIVELKCQMEALAAATSRYPAPGRDGKNLVVLTETYPAATAGSGKSAAQMGQIRPAALAGADRDRRKRGPMR